MATMLLKIRDVYDPETGEHKGIEFSRPIPEFDPQYETGAFSTTAAMHLGMAAWYACLDGDLDHNAARERLNAEIEAYFAKQETEAQKAPTEE